MNKDQRSLTEAYDKVKPLTEAPVETPKITYDPKFTGAPFSLTHPDTAATMEALAQADTAAKVTMVLENPKYQKIILDFINTYRKG
jgi:hypothetical protein